MEKERQDQSSDEQSEQLEHTVSIIGEIKKIKLDKGKRYQDLVSAVKAKYGKDLENLSWEKCNIVLNGEVIEGDKNPILSRTSILTIMPQITGGDTNL